MSTKKFIKYKSIDADSLEEQSAILLINTYPNAIAEEDGVIDIEETAYNFAEVIMTKFNKKQQKKYFNQEYENIDEWYLWILTYIPDLSEKCYEVLENNNARFEQF